MTDSNEASARDNKFLEMSGPPEHPAQAHKSYSLEKKADTTESAKQKLLSRISRDQTTSTFRPKASVI